MFICLVYNTTVTKFCLLSPRTSIYHKDNIKSIKEKLFDMFRGVEPQQEQYKMGIEARYNMELNNQVKYCHGSVQSSGGAPTPTGTSLFQPHDAASIEKALESYLALRYTCMVVFGAPPPDNTTPEAIAKLCCAHHRFGRVV